MQELDRKRCLSSFSSDGISFIHLGEKYIDPFHSHYVFICAYYVLIPIMCSFCAHSHYVLIVHRYQMPFSTADFQAYLFERVGLRMYLLELSPYLYLRFKVHHILLFCAQISLCVSVFLGIALPSTLVHMYVQE